MAKSTFVLVILFGVHYVCLVAIDPSAYELSVPLEIAKLYFELPFSSIQVQPVVDNSRVDNGLEA